MEGAGRAISEPVLVDGVHLHVEELGSGPGVPLVLVHGLGGTGRGIWGRQLEPLARRRRVVAYDLRGSGSSDVPPGPYSIERHVLDLEAVVGWFAADRVALAGHSMGGSIVLAYAAGRPERVAAAVGVGAPSELTQTARDGLRARADTVEEQGMAAVAQTVATNGTAPSFRERDPQGFRAFVALLEANDPRGYAAQCRGLAELALTDSLGRIEAPVLLLAGDHDGAAPPAASTLNAQRIPHARFVELPDCGHIVTWEQPAILLEETISFLTSIDEGAR